MPMFTGLHIERHFRGPGSSKMPKSPEYGGSFKRTGGPLGPRKSGVVKSVFTDSPDSQVRVHDRVLDRSSYGPLKSGDAKILEDLSRTGVVVELCG